MKKKLEAEAKAFDRITTFRVNKKFSYDLQSKKVNNFFYNNPWRYPETRKIAFLEKIEFIKKYLKKNSNILDVGCGGGSLSLELARSGHKITGIDISEKSIKIAKHTAKNALKKKFYNKIRFLNKSFDQVDIKNNEKYDAVVFFKTLHHLQNTKKVIHKTRSILKKNGRIIVVEPLRDNISKINVAFAFLARALLETWEKSNRKIKKYQNIENNFQKLFKEYTYQLSKKGYDQSPFDNSISSSNDVIKQIKKFFRINKIVFKDAFKDKIIGGIRGKSRPDYIKLIDNFDNFLINKKIAQGSTLMLVAKKK